MKIQDIKISKIKHGIARVLFYEDWWVMVVLLSIIVCQRIKYEHDTRVLDSQAVQVEAVVSNVHTRCSYRGKWSSDALVYFYYDDKYIERPVNVYHGISKDKIPVLNQFDTILVDFVPSDSDVRVRFISKKRSSNL